MGAEREAEDRPPFKRRLEIDLGYLRRSTIFKLQKCVLGSCTHFRDLDCSENGRSSSAKSKRKRSMSTHCRIPNGRQSSTTYMSELLQATARMQHANNDPDTRPIRPSVPNAALNADQNVASVAPQLVDGQLDEIQSPIW